MRTGLFVLALLAALGLFSSLAHAQTPIPDPFEDSYGPQPEARVSESERIAPPAPRAYTARVLRTDGTGRRFLELGDGWQLASSGVSLRPTGNLRIRDDGLAFTRPLWGGRLHAGGWRSKLSLEGLPRLGTEHYGLRFVKAF